MSALHPRRDTHATRRAHDARVPDDTGGPRSDAALLARARAGDGRAWRQLVERHTPVLSAVARTYRLTEADTADAVQLTWLRCVEHAHRIHAPDRLRAWLLTTCRRESLRLVRRRSKSVPEDSTNPMGTLARLDDPDPHTDPEATAVRAEASRRLYEAIADLPVRQRRILDAFVALDGVGTRRYVDIAGALDLPIGSIGPTRQRALQALRRDPRVARLRVHE